MGLDLTDDKSILAQVMAWCHQATCHYLSQCWPRSLSPYGVTRSEWVNPLWQSVANYVSNLGQHWLRYWLVACSAPGYDLNNDDLLSIGPLGTNFSDIQTDIHFVTEHEFESVSDVTMKYIMKEQQLVPHYSDVIMRAMASQVTSLTIVYSTVYSGAAQRKHQSSASVAFVWGIHRWPVNSPHKWPVTRKMFPFNDVLMLETWVYFVGHMVLLN